jgi:hypothetical protein
MALLIDKLVELIWDYSPLGASSMLFIPKQALTGAARELPTVLPGLKRPVAAGYHFKSARALGSMAVKREADGLGPHMAVLFRDCDGTRSDTQRRWDDLHKSMVDGFAVANTERGVPMIPNAKSEVWLLCAVKNGPYQGCAALEQISGNDNSPNSAKRLLDDALAARGLTSDDVCGLIEQGVISATTISMPSYDSFRDRLQHVAAEMH